MTPLEHIRNLFAYGRWANGKTLESLAPLTQEEIERSVGGSFGSVGGTLRHLLAADWVWLERFHGRSPRSLQDARPPMALAELGETWRAIQQGHERLIEGLSAQRLEEKLTYVNFAGQTWTYPLGEALVHVANHGTYHRGQVVTLLRQLGKTAIPTDYLRFLDAGSPR